MGFLFLLLLLLVVVVGLLFSFFFFLFSFICFGKSKRVPPPLLRPCLFLFVCLRFVGVEVPTHTHTHTHIVEQCLSVRGWATSTKRWEMRPTAAMLNTFQKMKGCPGEESIRGSSMMEATTATSNLQNQMSGKASLWTSSHALWLTNYETKISFLWFYCSSSLLALVQPTA